LLDINLPARAGKLPVSNVFNRDYNNKKINRIKIFYENFFFIIPDIYFTIV
jgi:hypothetical protein